MIQGLLFQVAADTLRTIAADPRHLGARIGLALVLRSWGSALPHHPHVHGIVPGGGLSSDARSPAGLVAFRRYAQMQRTSDLSLRVTCHYVRT